MFAAFDPVEPAVPGAPLVNGSVDSLRRRLTLNWPEPDNGGSAVTAYKVYRAPAQSGPYTLLATVSVNNYTDSALQADNWYRVTAVNAIGESPYCHEFHPENIVVPDPCVLPGVLVTSDFNPDGSDKDSGANTPVDPRVNARQLYVGEHLRRRRKQAFFTLQVAPSPGSTSAPPTASGSSSGTAFREQRLRIGPDLRSHEIGPVRRSELRVRRFSATARSDESGAERKYADQSSDADSGIMILPRRNHDYDFEQQAREHCRRQ